jgi:hypothetical protein
MEINPVLDEKQYHHMVFELKSDFCQGFQIISKDKFLFIDSRKIVTKLERKKETRALEEICEINLKEKDS